MEPHDSFEPIEFRVRLPGVVRWITQELFAVVMTTYVAFFLIDSLIEGFVSSQLNFNLLFWVIAVTGVLSIVLNRHSTRTARSRQPATSIRIIVLCIFVGVIVGYTLYLNSRAFDEARVALSLLAALLTVGVLLAVYFSRDQDFA